MIIKKCEKEISDIVDKKISEGLHTFEAIDDAFIEYKLEDEIIIKYEIEKVKKSNKLPKDLELTSEQINDYKNKIEKLVYNKYMNQIDKNSSKA